MINMKNTRVVDLTWEINSRVTRLDGSIEEGTRDVYNMPWIVEETINERDGTMEHLVGGNRATIPEWR
ncbi:MAG TPA: hypothetical protein DDZ38_02520, partial [Gammaproteobacteria bacterium]|nr:hypothetical protein [Gammaproteobacteria bacterium]